MHTNPKQNNLFIVYTIDSDNADNLAQVKLPVTAEDISTNGVIDRKKVIAIAASNEVENNQAVLDPVVMDSNMNVVG